MITGSLFRIAVDALRANKLRSGLTLLGVIIGVTSVMTIVSALQGMQDAIKEDLSQFGPSTFIVARLGIVIDQEHMGIRQTGPAQPPDTVATPPPQSDQRGMEVRVAVVEE